MAENRRLNTFLIEVETPWGSDGDHRKTAALHDVTETKGVSVLRQNVSVLYLIQMQRVSLKVGISGEKKGAPLHDVLETKGFSNEKQKSCKNLFL